MQRLAIVGAGITGLTAASELATAGHAGTVFEDSDSASGTGSREPPDARQGLACAPTRNRPRGQLDVHHQTGAVVREPDPSSMELHHRAHQAEAETVPGEMAA